MVSGHVHSIKLNDDNYHHLYNLQFMNKDEIRILLMSLSGEIMPSEGLPIVNSLKKSIEDIIRISEINDGNTVFSKDDISNCIKKYNKDQINNPHKPIADENINKTEENIQE